MPLCLTVACAVAVAPVVGLPTAFWQSAPLATEPGTPPVRVRERAVVLVHGLQPHPLRPKLAARPEVRAWQKPAAELVRALTADADVYGFSYAQTVPVDVVSGCRGLQDAVASLKAAGYNEIVLVGHSAGGLVARHFAERFPDRGVTKVVMVATPHVGSRLANLRVGVPAVQAPFVRSLSPKSRAGWPEYCACPSGIGFASVVCKLPRLAGDTVVAAASQWPEELQKLGVPASVVPVSHTDAMRDPRAVAAIAELVRADVPRWTPEQVEVKRRALFGDGTK